MELHMKSIHWTRFAQEPESDAPRPPEPADPTPKKRPPTADRDEMRDSAEHKVLRNIARTYARYYGPHLD